jgi:hypothetical protein
MQCDLMHKPALRTLSVPISCGSSVHSEADRLALMEEEEKQADALEGVEIDDPTIKAALEQPAGDR